MEGRTKEGIAYFLLAISFTILAFGIYVNIHPETYEELAGITGKASSGEVSICIDQGIKFSNKSLVFSTNTGELFSYDVNITDEASFSIINFTDDADFIYINNTSGQVEFTPNLSQQGFYVINLTVGNNRCREPDDTNIMNLTIIRFNHAPTLELAARYILTEDEAFIYNFTPNASDPDLDILKFYDNTSMFVIGEDSGVVAITPINDDVGNYSIRFYVVDNGIPAKSDFNDTVFEIRNVNDAPLLNPVGAQTAYINITFNLALTGIEVDPEDNLAFSSNTSWFLNNSGPITPTGYIAQHDIVLNFTNYTEWNGTYSINITVNDTKGIQDSEVISFTITDYNYPPNITSYYPPNKTMTLNYDGSQIFNITKYDPDGTIPSTKWSVAHAFTGTTADEFTFAALDYSAGTHNVTVNITDGELNDSESWLVTVLPEPPPPPPQAGGAPGSGPSSFGGGKGRYICEPLWVCTDWSECNKAGIQNRECKDFYACGTMEGQPIISQSCIYVEVPSCFDGVKNQDEVLPDCGGVCPPCPTCDDGIQNQEEEYVDCGGPCPVCQEERLPTQPPAPAYPKWGAWLVTSLVALTALRLGQGLVTKKGLWKALGKLPSTFTVWRVNYLLRRADWEMNRKNFAKARRIYSKARGLYSDLPSEKQVKVRR